MCQKDPRNFAKDVELKTWAENLPFLIGMFLRSTETMKKVLRISTVPITKLCIVYLQKMLVLLRIAKKVSYRD